MPESDTLTVFDVNKDMLKKFAEEAVPKGVQVASGPQEVAQKSVRLRHLQQCMRVCLVMSYCSIYDLSWGASAPFPDFTNFILKPIL